ncbi:hypothetical protein BDR22DRAFT_887812 [Usnea florida]
MHVSLAFCIGSVLLLPIAITHASNPPRGDKHSSPDKSQVAAILPQYPPSPGRGPESDYVQLKSADGIVKRDNEQADDLWIRGIILQTLHIPIVAAAYSLEQFYNAILSNALDTWGSMEPQQSLMMTMGPLQLSMHAVLDSGVTQGIPWAFVQNFARNMLAVTGMGFTGTYDMFFTRFNTFGTLFSSPLPNLGVHVVFRVSW